MYTGSATYICIYLLQCSLGCMVVSKLFCHELVTLGHFVQAGKDILTDVEQTSECFVGQIEAW